MSFLKFELTASALISTPLAKEVSKQLGRFLFPDAA